jgi:hypothetical protein
MFNILQATGILGNSFRKCGFSNILIKVTEQFHFAAYSSNFRGKEEEEEKEEEGATKNSRGSYVYGGTNESV